jgi:hypothetical protein
MGGFANSIAYGIVLVRIDHRHRHEKAGRARYLFTAHAADLPHSMTTLPGPTFARAPP